MALDGRSRDRGLIHTTGAVGLRHMTDPSRGDANPSTQVPLKLTRYCLPITLAHFTESIWPPGGGAGSKKAGFYVGPNEISIFTLPRHLSSNDTVPCCLSSRDSVSCYLAQFEKCADTTNLTVWLYVPKYSIATVTMVTDTNDCLATEPASDC